LPRARTHEGDSELYQRGLLGPRQGAQGRRASDRIGRGERPEHEKGAGELIAVLHWYISESFANHSVEERVDLVGSHHINFLVALGQSGSADQSFFDHPHASHSVNILDVHVVQFLQVLLYLRFGQLRLGLEGQHVVVHLIARPPQDDPVFEEVVLRLLLGEVAVGRGLFRLRSTSRPKGFKKNYRLRAEFDNIFLAFLGMKVAIDKIISNVSTVSISW
jgi:hypothetical protein